MKEADIKHAIAQYLQIGMNQGKWYSDRLNSGVAFVPCGVGSFRKIQLCREGTADFMVIEGLNKYLKTSRVIFLEVKSETGKQSKVQKEFQKLVEAQGASYFIIRSVEDVQAILE
jgi:hypothetical protein